MYMFCRSLFVFLYFFFWPLCCLIFFIYGFWLPLSYLQTLFDKGKTQETYQPLLPNWFEPMVSKKTMSDSYYGFFISFICMFDIHHLKEMFQGKTRRYVKLLVCSKFSTFWITIVQYLSIDEFFIFKSGGNLR